MFFWVSVLWWGAGRESRKERETGTIQYHYMGERERERQAQSCSIMREGEGEAHFSITIWWGERQHNSVSLYGGEREAAQSRSIMGEGEGEAHFSSAIFIILTQKPTFDQVIYSLFEGAIFNWKHLLSFVQMLEENF